MGNAEEELSERVQEKINAIVAESVAADDIQESSAYAALRAQVMNDAAGERIKKAAADAAELTNAQTASNIKLRRNFGIAVFILLCTWAAVIMGVVIASGYEGGPVKVSDAVQIALISGVSLSVVGLFAVVMNYLFPTK